MLERKIKNISSKNNFVRKINGFKKCQISVFFDKFTLFNSACKIFGEFFRQEIFFSEKNKLWKKNSLAETLESAILAPNFEYHKR